MSRRRGSNNQPIDLMQLLAFCAVILLGLWAFIIFIVNGTGFITIGGRGVQIINNIGVALGAIVAMFYSYRFARTRGTAWFVIWVIAVVVLIVFLVLGLFVGW